MRNSLDPRPTDYGVHRRGQTAAHQGLAGPGRRVLPLKVARKYKRGPSFGVRSFVTEVSFMFAVAVWTADDVMTLPSSAGVANQRPTALCCSAMIRCRRAAFPRIRLLRAQCAVRCALTCFNRVLKEAQIWSRGPSLTWSEYKHRTSQR